MALKVGKKTKTLQERRKWLRRLSTATRLFGYAGCMVCGARSVARGRAPNAYP